MRNNLFRVQFSAFGAALTLLAVMFAVSRGRTPAGASAAGMPLEQPRTFVATPTSQPALVSDASH